MKTGNGTTAPTHVFTMMETGNGATAPTPVFTMMETGNGTTAPAPVITATETGNAPTSPKPKPPPYSKRRRKLRWCLFVTALLVVALAIVILVLALTVFRSKSPKSTVVSVRVTGVSPRVYFPALRIELNVTLILHTRIHNPNYASFQHAAGTALLYYHGRQIGQAEVEPGRIPSRGSADVRSRLTLEVDNLVSDLGDLIGDVVGGELGIDSRTRIPGRVTILGIIKRHAVARINCHLAIGFPKLKIKRQDCDT